MAILTYRRHSQSSRRTNRLDWRIHSAYKSIGTAPQTRKEPPK
jgi:hypothetical protein